MNLYDNPDATSDQRERVREDRAHAAKVRCDPGARTLGAIIMAAVLEREELLANGGDRPAIDQAFEEVIRDVWPKGREEPWHDLCASCGDYGLVLAQCSGDASCGRKPGHGAHTYGMPCWCPAGKRFRAKPDQSPEDGLAAAAKTTKPTRFGR